MSVELHLFDSNDGWKGSLDINASDVLQLRCATGSRLAQVVQALGAISEAFGLRAPQVVALRPPSPSAAPVQVAEPEPSGNAAVTQEDSASALTVSTEEPTPHTTFSLE